MGRHTPARTARPATGRRRGPVVAVGLAALVVLGAVTWVVTRTSDAAPAGAAPAGAVSAGCRVDVAVRVAVDPAVGGLVREALSGPIPLDDDRCAVAEVRTEPPLQTLGALIGGDPVDPVQVWVPDDVSWVTRAGTTVDPAAPELARTALVLATSRAVADGLGWSTTPPTWSDALLSVGAVLPDPTATAAGVLTLAALQTSAGPGEPGDAAVARAVLDAGRPGSSTDQALAAAVAGDPGAPVVVATEQQIAAASPGGAGQLAVVVPVEGTPVLSVPVVRTAAGRDDVAVDAVVDLLAATASDGAAVRAAGWRDTTGRAGDGAAGPRSWELDADLVAAVPARVAELAARSRWLAVVDTSTSMGAPVGDGTRATLARDALTTVLAVLPDRAAGGLWVVAAGPEDDRAGRELVPLRPLGTQVGGRSQRELLAERFAELPDLPTTGGTGLDDTVLAAVRAARDGADPAAVTTVVLVTDGASGTGEQELLDTLAAEADPARPVRVVAVGIGPDADQDALERIATATGGAAYAAVDRGDLQTVLLEALRGR
ncbi:von Willebrand factor type A domain-containing protein [Klenkia soli]|uniref:von Willebrand factor type A domain-containing protein n=1 Tax=Klenkia soli TaxID=1052260 RepID=A0A1H0N0R0_9ACTN|nr:VWA domain-containing protein [Klenkia soli]SDO86288.1 von Willebrand factor type A domain-containing protein [Klenkia soli]